jgi:hypothetical protein
VTDPCRPAPMQRWRLGRGVCTMFWKVPLRLLQSRPRRSGASDARTDSEKLHGSLMGGMTLAAKPRCLPYVSDTTIAPASEPAPPLWSRNSTIKLAVLLSCQRQVCTRLHGSVGGDSGKSQTA